MLDKMNSPAIKKRILILLCVCGAGLILLSGCGEILQKPQPEPFVGQNAPPPPKEFRWSNGDLPKTFDPAKAVASPETDFVRAMFDGLTDLDAKTLKPVPAIAAQWEASDDFRTWTFRLRQSARWTNGKPIVAKDFVRSWRRVAEMGDKTENFKLFQNIVGTHFSQAPKPQIQSPKPETINNEQRTTNNEQTWFGAEAADELVLRVWLIEPDKDFPALTAHPAFRPVFDHEAEFENLESAAKIVSSGAFRVISADKTGVSLENSKNYWNAQAVNLERVKIVPMKDADAALAAYRAGELDAVTNAKFEPLAVKLLASYQDFRRSAFNAVTFYEFNPKRAHLADRRVRQALSLAVDRERLTADELDGAFAPARSLLPHLERSDFRFDAEQARRLLAEAGFKDGKDFPKIKLLISRNDVQRRVARAVAAQWKRHLGIETEIVTSSFEELEQTFDAGDFDLIRRARVLPTTDETANLQLMFETEPDINEQLHISPETAMSEAQPDSTEQTAAPKIGGIEMPRLVPNEKDSNVGFESGRPKIERVKILNEEIAVKEFPAIPLFYPMTYALVKPYVKNFETNMLDAPQLKAVEIESNWQR
ncbi:MAG TPA: peptide ABC transporter substrate-binding protein [Pyrinomonadaceae bacterium]|jgi:oligopeptide transport system substrate-binding protein